MDEDILICMIGLPLSGKTTWAKKQGFPIVCPDAIRLALHGQRYIQEAEPWVWTIAKTMANSLFLAGHDHVIIDATNNSKKRREFWQAGPWCVRWKWIDTAPTICLARAEQDGDMPTIPVIERMAAEMDTRPTDNLWHDS